MSMFRRFTETINPDNRFSNLCTETIDEIIVGGTCNPLFILPFPYSKYIVNSKIMYQQGLETVLEKYPNDYILEELPNDTTILRLKLSKEDTLKFTNPLLKTYVQIKFETVDNKILYNNLNRVKVIFPVQDLNPPNEVGC